MKNWIFILLSIISTPVFSAEESPLGKISGYFTGWGLDQVRVTVEGAAYTESNCPVKDGYMTIKSDDSGYETHISALLAAFMSGKSVKIIVDGCIVSRPRIVGVYVY